MCASIEGDWKCELRLMIISEHIEKRKKVIKIKAILLCAGYATRLYPLTQNQPKALLSIGEKTILGHIMDQVEQLGEVDEVFVVTNDRFLSNFWSWRETYNPKKKVHLFSDGTKSNDERIGAIGDLQLVIERKGIDDDILVIAGDNLFEFSLRDFVGFSKAKKASAVALFDIKEKEKAAKRYGVAKLDGDGRVTEFQEKPANPETSLVSTACYVFTGESMRKLREYAAQGGKKDNPGDYVTWLMRQEPLYGFIFRERWFDIGSFEALEEAYEWHKLKAAAETPP